MVQALFKAFLFSDIPAGEDDQIPACVIGTSQSHIYDFLFAALAAVRALDRDGNAQGHRAYQAKNSFPRGSRGKIPRAHLEQLLLFITQQRASSGIYVNNPAIEVSDENGLRDLRKQLFRELQPSPTFVEFAPEPLEFAGQPVGRCLSAFSRLGAAVHSPLSTVIRSPVKFLPNFRYGWTSDCYS
jgi:hypothetical protein